MNSINVFFDSLVICMFNFFNQNVKIKLDTISFDNLFHKVQLIKIKIAFEYSYQQELSQSPLDDKSDVASNIKSGKFSNFNNWIFLHTTI